MLGISYQVAWGGKKLKRGKKAKNVTENFGALKISAESFGDYSALINTKQ